ncbi:MAG: hypothetical protein ACRD59_16195 [Candidatus Acidiferrales bacterium]
MKFTLYPIYWIATEIDGAAFNLERLPFAITEGVRVEFVGNKITAGAFDVWQKKLGTSRVEELMTVRYALVHRYETEPMVVEGRIVGERFHSVESDKLVRMLAACLRLIRPMRQNVLTMRGSFADDDGPFELTGFDLPPLHLQEVPEVQKLFKLRDQDIDDLRTYAPRFLEAMRGEFWKFRMAVQFHELGHFQALDWKARYLHWCSAIESIYTSHRWEHQGSLVATSRIRWLLGEQTSTYAPGDLSDLLEDPRIAVGQIVDDLYDLRNFLAHGDKVPDAYFNDTLRVGFGGEVKRCEVLTEAASFIVRTSLLKILRDNLLAHFADAGPAEAYFGRQRLTRTELQRAALADGARANLPER